MRDIKEIILHLENCEDISFQAKHIGEIYIGKISEEIHRVACNSISQYKVANAVAIEIFKEVNNGPYYSFEIENSKSKKFKRLTDYRDITQIELIDKDDNSYTYFANYKEEVEGQLGTNNLNQKAYISELGNLYIVIEEDKDVFDYFNKEDINNPEVIDFHKEMIME